MGKGSKKRSKEKESVGATIDSDEGDDEKPLPKLVLKVGKEKKLKAESSEASTIEVEHTHHKKKKKKHKHKVEEVEKKSRKREATEPADVETPVKRSHRTSKDKEKKHAYKEAEIPPLRLCLENLCRNLQRKDVYGIFTYPVTDLIAPGYSKIIKTPMDFLTMSKKIENGGYTSIEPFKNDYVIMCNNAMLYNGSDTIYYKSAEKMLGIGIKMLTKDKIRKMNKSLRLPVSDSEDDLVQADESSDVNIDSIHSAEEQTYSPKKRTPERKSKKDNSKSQSIAASILAAAREARQKLLKNTPDQVYGYLSKDSQGNTSLNVLNPDTAEENKYLPVTLGKIAGKLQTGIVPGQVNYKDGKKNKVIPVSYLIYGPYGSFGPTYDSSVSNMTKTESNLLLQTYGTELGVAYAKSLHDFTKDSPYTSDYVDRILDTMTEGAHGKYLKAKKEKELAAANLNSSFNDQTAPKVPKSGEMNKCNTQINSTESNNSETALLSGKVDIESLLTLDDVGIDVSFLKEIVKPAEDKEKPCKLQEKLNQNGQLLRSLKESQNERMSTKMGGVIPIRDMETRLATSLTNNLKELMTMVAPKDVVSSDGVRKAIGISNTSPHTDAQKVEIIIDDDRTEESAITSPNTMKSMQYMTDLSFEEATDEEQVAMDTS